MNVINANQIRGYAVPELGSTHGHSLSWNAVAAGATSVDAIWAYTAQ